MDRCSSKLRNPRAVVMATLNLSISDEPTNKRTTAMSATATMTVNVYSESLRDVDEDGDDSPRVFLRKKQVKDAQGRDLPFKHHGIKILIGDRVTHTDLGKNKKDDDTAAITFWYSKEDERQKLVKIFERALAELNRPEAKN
jgi:hypothetical protein